MDTSHPTSSPPHRLTQFFRTLHASLKIPSRAVFQFYPSSDDQIALITSLAQRAGFGGGIVVDYPNSNKARKVYLVLMVGGGGGSGGSKEELPKGLTGEGEEEGVDYERRRAREKGRKEKGRRKGVKDKDWILRKKEVCLCGSTD
jgi:18S rRNA (guanine1575-N7)-methyltransferase